MNKSVNSLSGKDKKDVVLYAGGLNKEYGIMQLVEAVKSIKNEIRLDFYKYRALAVWNW